MQASLLEPVQPAARLQKALTIMYILLATYYAALGTWVSSSQYLLERRDISRSSALLIVSFLIFIIIMTETISQPFWAALSDRAGRRWSILVGGFGQCIAFIIFTRLSPSAWILAAALFGTMDSIDAVAPSIIVDCVKAGAVPGSSSDFFVMRTLRSIWFTYTEDTRGKSYSTDDLNMLLRTYTRSRSISFENEIVSAFGLVNLWVLTGFILGLGTGTYISTHSFLLPAAPLIAVSAYFLILLFALQHLPETSRRAQPPSSLLSQKSSIAYARSTSQYEPFSLENENMSEDEFENEDDDEKSGAHGNSSKSMRIDALEPADVCLQTVAAFRLQGRALEVLFESPAPAFDGFVLGLTYFATHLQVASLVTGVYWTHRTEHWIPFGLVFYYPATLVATFLGLLWYLIVLAPRLGPRFSLALCLALATAARIALAMLQSMTNYFNEPAAHTIQLILHSVCLLGLVILATFTIGLIPVVNGMISTRTYREAARGGRVQSGILHISKFAMFTALLADVIVAKIYHRNATWLISPTISTLAALTCVFWIRCKPNPCGAGSCVVPEEPLTDVRDNNEGSHPLQTCTDPENAALYGTFPGDLNSSFATMT